MKLFKQLMSVVLSFSLILSFCCMAFATDSLSIDTVTIQKYTDELGVEDESLVTFTVDFTIVDTAEQMTVLLASENITDLSENVEDKIVFIDQAVVPSETTYTFVVEKSRIASATGLSDIEGCTLYLKMGGQGIDTAAYKEVVYNDPYKTAVFGDVTGDGVADIGDAIKLLRYDAKLVTLTEDELALADVTGNGEVDIADAVKILRYDAKLEDSLK